MKTILAIFVIIGAYITCAMGIDRYVSPSGTNDTAGGYTNWAGAATQIQWAVDAANAATADTVLVSNGTYNLTNQIMIVKAITLKSVNGTNVTFINGNYPAYTNCCLYIINGVTVSGFTISNGFSLGSGINQGGGGVFMNQGGLVTNCLITQNYVSNNYGYSGGGGAFLYQGGVLTHCAIVGNTVLNSSDVSYNRRGGGVYMDQGGMITNCSLIGNVAQKGGGGVYIYNGGTAVCCVIAGNSNVLSDATGGGIIIQTTGSKALNCVISQNYSPGKGGGVEVPGNGVLANSIVSNNMSADCGGGVYMDWGGTVSNCVICNNIATNGGGGMWIGDDHGFYIVDRCTINNNRALKSTGGGGINALDGGLIRNCAIYGNSTVNNGGGVYLDNNAATNKAAPAGLTTGLVNCTISSNTTTTKGGGIYVTGQSNCIENCIVFFNIATGDANNDLYHADAFNTNNYWYTCVPVTLAPNQGNITNNPSFVGPGNNNYRLSANSPCVNTGTNHDWMTNSFDLDGRIRIRYGRVDMGAYELIYNGAIFTIH